MTRGSVSRAAEDDPAVAWLLASEDPSVRYLTLTEVLGRSPLDRAVRAARESIPDGPKVRRLLAGQRADGGFGVHPYKKWFGAHWRLVSLVELALPADHPKARQALETVLDWLDDPDYVARVPRRAGRWRAHASMEGNALAVACRLGRAEDPRVTALAERLVAWQWPDGGWNCDDRPQARHASFHESLPALWGLSEYARRTGDDAAREAADRAAEFLLRHRLFRSETTGEVIDRRWLTFHYPPYWHFDVLQGLLVLARHGRVKDARAAEALDVVASRRTRDGRWRGGSRHWRLRTEPGKRPVEIVDWGRRGPNAMVTLNALRVLRAAGRLPEGGDRGG